LTEERRFKEVVDADQSIVIRDTLLIAKMLYEKRSQILAKAREAIREVREGKVRLTTGDYIRWEFEFNIISYAQREAGVIGSYSPDEGPARGNKYHPVFENEESIGLFTPQQKGNPVAYENEILKTIEWHLTEGMNLLEQARVWLATHPQYLRDFYKNAFYNENSGCFPRRLVLLNQWVQRRVAANPQAEGETIYDEFMMPNNFFNAIAKLVVYFKDQKIIEFIQKYPQYLTAPLEAIEANAEFPKIYNKQGFVKWVLDATRNAYKAKDYGYFDSSEFSDPAAINRVVDEAMLF